MMIMRMPIIKNIVSSLLLIVLLTDCSSEYAMANTSWDNMDYGGYEELSSIKVYTLSLTDKIK